MSHYYSLTCRACNLSSESYNHAKADLEGVARTAALVRALADTDAWDVGTLRSARMEPLGSFVAAHAKCDAFWVESEYGEPRYPSVRVPVAPPAEMASVAADVHRQAAANSIADWLLGHGIVFRGVAEEIRKGAWK